MISLRWYLDSRRNEAESPLRLALTKRGDTAYISTQVRIPAECWDKHKQQVVKHPRKTAINSFLRGFRYQVEDYVNPMLVRGDLADMTATQIAEMVREHFNGKRVQVTLGEVWDKVADGRKGRTSAIYRTGLSVLLRHDEHARGRAVTSITEKYVQDYDDWLTENYAPNTRNHYIMLLHSVMERAVDDKAVARNPVRVKVASVETKKRNLSAEDFRRFWNEPTISAKEELALDFFKFSFLLRACNTIDCLSLTPASIFNGRVEYDRSKTGKHYSIRIDAELRELIDKRTDGVHLFPNNRRSRDYTTFSDFVNRHLFARSARLGMPQKVTMYWARHSFASLAYEVGESMDMVSELLGHSHGASVTATYVNPNTRLADEATRRVLDYALYGVKENPVPHGRGSSD